MKIVWPMSLLMVGLLSGCGNGGMTQESASDSSVQPTQNDSSVSVEAEETSVREIDQPQLLDWIENSQPAYTLIDVRSPEEFASGHIETAVNIPFDQILDNPDLVTEHNDQPVVIYCRSGNRAGKVTDMLKQKSLTKNIYHLTGDINGWNEANLPLSH